MTIDIVQNKQRPARILLVEDSPGDVILTRRAFKGSKIANSMSVATSGEEAVAMLSQEGEYAESELPDIILLDLNLPRMSGKDVLQIVKGDPRTSHIPVVMLSSSRAEQDVIKSYQLHANGYVVKPLSLEKFTEVVQKIEQFWFTLVVLPDAADIAPKE